MTTVKIRGVDIDIDIRAELEEYEWRSPTWSATKLNARSPFRFDGSPSFFVSLEGEYAGAWADKGTGESGGLARLLAYLRSESVGETEEYLLERYGIEYSESGNIRLPTPRIATRTERRILAPSIVTAAISPYLTRRGISEEVQALYGVGFTEGQRGYCAMPWRFPNGDIGTVKYRSTSGKKFFYAKGGTQVRNLVYGIDVAEEEAVLCEAEIDAKSFAVAGMRGIALGGSKLSVVQADMIRRSKIRRLIVAGDNDVQGRLLNEQVLHLLGGEMEICVADYGTSNDANEVLLTRGIGDLKRIYHEVEKRRLIPVDLCSTLN